MTLLEKPQPLHSQIYTLLKKELVEGEFNPGERIVETKLAKKYGVSRGPIREALRLLEQDNLVEQKDNHLFVVHFNKQEIIEIYQCRELLDAFAAELACQHITTEEIEILRNALEQTELARQSNDAEKVIHYNTIFHETIVYASRNRILISLLESLRNRMLIMRRMRNTLMTHYLGYEYFLEEHQGVLEAIINNRPDLAKKRMADHIGSDIQAFLNFMGTNQIQQEKNI